MPIPACSPTCRTWPNWWGNYRGWSKSSKWSRINEIWSDCTLGFVALVTLVCFLRYFSAGQVLADLHILTEERIILQLYEITQIFVDFLQRYDNMGKGDLPYWFKLSHNIDYAISSSDTHCRSTVPQRFLEHHPSSRSHAFQSIWKQCLPSEAELSCRKKT